MHMKGENTTFPVFTSPFTTPNKQQIALEFSKTEKIVAIDLETDIYWTIRIKLFLFDVFVLAPCFFCVHFLAQLEPKAP